MRGVELLTLSDAQQSFSSRSAKAHMAEEMGRATTVMTEKPFNTKRKSNAAPATSAVVIGVRHIDCG